MWRIAVLACTAALLPAQQGSVAGPVAGYVFDRSAQALRPVLGIPGAARMGDALGTGYRISAAWVAPRQDFAVVVAADGSLHFLKLDSGTAAERAAGSVNGIPEMVAFSPSGTAAALYASGMVQLVTGLPDAPKLASAVDLGETRRAAPSRGIPARRARLSLAVTDDGALLLAAAGGPIRLFDAGGGNRSLTDAPSGMFVAFAPGAHDAAVVGSDSALILRSIDGAVERQALGTAGLPAGLAFSADGREVFVATKSSVVAFEIATGSRSEIACNCAPVGLIPMGRAFRLNELDAGPLWLLDAASGEPRTVFVPAAIQAATQ
jgi:hypothetical protein